MMKNWRNIGIAFLVGAFCRYIFFLAYGYFSFVSVRYEFKESFIGLFPKFLGSTIFLFQNLFEILITAFISIFIPAVIFGYCAIESKKRYWIYSISSFVGIICFDLFYYSFVFNDLNLLLNNYLPVWYGAVVVFMWIVLFYWLYSFGKYLRDWKGANPIFHCQAKNK